MAKNAELLETQAILKQEVVILGVHRGVMGI